ncbi:Putative amino acid/polyamine transporter I [Septoria linicola]|uniref:Amino acid/polyamine transporter I n=1 Tax=Septoria linicola TaxID=215465 RepID=A0A9Q9AUJ4_9PEZI|nr:putative amino acid/polyamine transporter I [Septoria linicola]USW52780.1 Putative amino acid/polyamine transporter I [Septoria linicola]
MEPPRSKFSLQKTREDILELPDPNHDHHNPHQPTSTQTPLFPSPFDDEMVATDLSDPGRMTSFDMRDMSRMGKRQEMRRVFRQFSILSFTCVIMATWEFLLTANTQGLVSGGRAGLFWSYIWTLGGFGLVIASMAEMASMAPTSGGQYHWVSEFAPEQYQKFLSYTTGWLSTMSYQAGNASGFFLAGTIIQSLAMVNYPEYSAPNWQSTMCVLAVVAVSGVFNIFFSRFFPVLNNISMVVHLAGFVAVVVVLWVLAPHPPAAEVLLHFQNSGGWPTTGLSLMVGQISAIAALGCSDAAAHMSEEVSDAGLSVPRSMMWTFYINGSTGLVFLVAILFAIPSVEEALNHLTGYPFLYIFQLAMPDTNIGTNILTVITIWGLLVGNVSFTASCARQAWSLARDRGLPFHAWISRMDTRVHVPVNATVLTLICTILLSLINLGSNAAFNAILSLQLSALMASYAIAITCIVLKRLRDPDALPKARWSLGRAGLPINIAASLYACFACFWSFWPNSTPADAESFNWAPVIFSVVMIFAMITYVVQGRYQFDGPVALVKRL